jgi:hypothetical protein
MINQSPGKEPGTPSRQARALVPYSRKPAIKNKKAGDSFEIKYLT